MSNTIRREVSLDEACYITVQQAAREMGLDDRGFSAALRRIIREWREVYPPPPARYLNDAPPGGRSFTTESTEPTEF